MRATGYGIFIHLRGDEATYLNASGAAHLGEDVAIFPMNEDGANVLRRFAIVCLQAAEHYSATPVLQPFAHLYTEDERQDGQDVLAEQNAEREKAEQ